MKSYRLVKPYFVEKRFVIAIGLFSLLLVDMLQLFIPRIIKWAVDDLAISYTTPTRLLHYALYIVGVAGYETGSFPTSRPFLQRILTKPKPGN
jgi:ATP-binding cassette subfamily B protein